MQLKRGKSLTEIDMETVVNPSDLIIEDADKSIASLSSTDEASAYERTSYDDSEKIKYIRTPNFTDCASGNTQLPINFANETISLLSKYRSEFDFVEFIKEKLNYNSNIAVCMAFYSEQIDALVLAIKQFESNRALILGDMAGIGKGRVIAGVLRYCYIQGLIPVFITEKENLFSSMYRDIMGIGGFGSDLGNPIRPIPLIMKPQKSSVIEAEDGTKKKVLNNGIVDDNDNILQRPPTDKELNELITSYRELPPKNNKHRLFASSNPYYVGKIYQNGTEADLKAKDINCVFLTYSVISSTRGESGTNKKYFLKEIAKNSIFVFDECHNASGQSSVGTWSRDYVADARGVMFSSATFAKSPQAFPLYIIKTAMAEAQVDVESLEVAITAGGENVSEYISSVLVKEGQMIRRERDFTGCDMGTVFDSAEKQEIFSKYNNAVIKFKEIYDYIKQESFANAIKFAVNRRAGELGYDLADQQAYIDCKGTSDDKIVAQRNFVRRYQGKWVILKYDKSTLGATTKFQFSENLFLSIKSSFLADSVIKELGSEIEYNNFDGKSHKTNRKPVIAIRATGEGILNKLKNVYNLESGDLVSNDFSEYIKCIVSGVMTGKVTFAKVNDNLFLSLDEKREKKAQDEIRKKQGKRALYNDEVTDEFEIINSDLPDMGVRLEELLNNANLPTDIPLSCIDYFIDKIQSVQRKRFEFNNPAYGFYKGRTPSAFYKVGEVTGRNNSLKKDTDSDMWVFSTNERIKSVNTLFNNFNSGKTDVLIINQSGSTGGSIQSSSEFSDQRPRIMFLAQNELNVSTEVQKRGRINRTGQVNYPAYLYVLSQVPSEIRKYLALKMKLRKLDANVSANQTQNSELVSIKNADDKEIQDIFNQYGEEAFIDLLADDDNSEFKRIHDTMSDWSKAFSEAYVSEGETTENTLVSFTRELDLYPCDMQEKFYNEMNELYLEVVAKHKRADTFHLEIDTEDLRASLKSRVVKQLYNGISEFSKPLFLEEKYCLPKRRLWTLDKIKDEEDRLAKKYYEDRDDDFTTLQKFHRDLMDDFDLTYEISVDERSVEYRAKHEPIRADYSTDEDYNTVLGLYEAQYTSYLDRLELDKTVIRNILSRYKPDMNVLFQYDGSIDSTGELFGAYGRSAKFVGYIFKKSSVKNKYSKGSIHLKFAFLQGAPTSVDLRLSNYNDIKTLQATLSRTDSTIQDEYRTGVNTFTDTLNRWEVNLSQRTVTRFLSGNILNGIQLANRMKIDEEIKRWSLVRYTNTDGTISTSIRLEYEDNINVERLPTTTREKIEVALNNDNIIEYIKNVPLDFVFYLPVNTQNSATVVKVKGSTNYVIEGLIKIRKNQDGLSPDMNTVYVEVFQGQIVAKARTTAEVRMLIDRNIPFKHSGQTNNPIYFASFLNNYTPIIEPYKEYSRHNYPVRSQEFIVNPKNVSGFSKIYQFTNIDEQAGAERLFKFLQKIHSEQSEIRLDFPQDIKDYYTVSDVTDEYVPKEEKEKGEQTIKMFDKSEYVYNLEVDYNANYEKSPPPSFLRYEIGQGAFDKGKIILSQPIKPTFAKAYNIYPSNFSDKDTITLVLQIFNEQEKVDFLRELNKMIEDGESLSDIGDFITIQTTRRAVPELKYLFGNRRVNEIAELMKRYALNPTDFALTDREYVEQFEDVIAMPKIKKKSTVTMDDAEKFINYLLF